MHTRKVFIKGKGKDISIGVEFDSSCSRFRCYHIGVRFAPAPRTLYFIDGFYRILFGLIAF